MRKLSVMAAIFFLPLLAGSVAGAQTSRARIADAPIRAEPNLASAIIATVKEGGPIEVVDLQGDWYRVLVPNEHGQPRVGYLLAHLVEIVNEDGSPSSIPAPPPTPTPPPTTQGPRIPPTAAQMAKPQDNETKRERELKAKVDALKADLSALQTDQSANRVSGEASLPEPDSLRARHGMWFYGGLGYGSLGTSGGDGRLNGGSGGLSFGGTINDRLLLGVGTSGYYKSEDGVSLTASTLDARLRFYPVRTAGFFITGGIGLGTISVGTVYFGTETETGLATMFGLGWDIPIGANVSLTPFWNGFAVANSTTDANVGQLGVGITVHRRQLAR